MRLPEFDGKRSDFVYFTAFSPDCQFRFFRVVFSACECLTFFPKGRKMKLLFGEPEGPAEIGRHSALTREPDADHAVGGKGLLSFWNTGDGSLCSKLEMEE